MNELFSTPVQRLNRPRRAVRPFTANCVRRMTSTITCNNNMKLQSIALLAGLIGTSAVTQPSTARAQGSLTPPPGAPSPVMKSLEQIEPRRPLNTLPGDATAMHIITMPGSYYLTSSINGSSGKAGIRVEAADVTLDLNGFTLEGTGGSTAGILINIAGGPVTIRNGSLRFWTTGGIIGTAATHVSLADLSIASISAGPGVFVGEHSTATRVKVFAAHRAGIHLGGLSGIADHCTVENYGIATSVLFPDLTDTAAIYAAVVTDSSVRGFVDGGSADVLAGIYSKMVERCRVSHMNMGGHMGIAIHGEIVRGCTVESIAGSADDLFGISGAMIEGNMVLDVGGPRRLGIVGGGYQARIANNTLTRCKIVAQGMCEVTGNRVSVDNNQVALEVNSSGSRISGNTVRAGTGTSTRGILVTGSGNLIEHNVVNVSTAAFGIYVSNQKNSIIQNTVSCSGGGIELVSGANNCRVDGNSVYGTNGTGIAVNSPATNNTIVRNSAIGFATLPFSIAGGNQMATAVTADVLDATVGPWANLVQP